MLVPLEERFLPPRQRTGPQTHNPDIARVENNIAAMKDLCLAVSWGKQS